MKKIIFLCLILVGFTFAQTNAGYFTEKTITTLAGQDKYIYGETRIAYLGAADSVGYIYTRPFGTASGLRTNASGKKIVIGFNITVAFANVAATGTVEVSADGTNWATQSTFSQDLTPDVTGAQVYVLDLTATYAPYVRIKFNASGLKIERSGRVKFFYAIPQ